MAPKSMAEAMQLAEILAKSSLIPEGFRGKPGDIVIAMEVGMNVGLPPMLALQSTAVINGRPVLWGDVPLGLVQAHKSYVSFNEWLEGDGESVIAKAKLTRTNLHGQLVTTERSFSYQDAKDANLLDKAGPWKQGYRKDMLLRRARGRVLSSGASDILKGLAPVDADYEIIEGSAVNTSTGEVVGTTKRERVGNVLAAAAANIAPPSAARMDLPDVSAMTDAEIGEVVASEARRRGVQPPELREIVKTVAGGRLVKSTAPSVLAALFKKPVLDIEDERP